MADRPPLSIAMCSNRPRNLANAGWLLDCAAAGDEIMLVVDLAPGPAETSVLTGLTARGVRVLVNGANRGLSHSRNQALAQCAHRHLVYVDDDIAVGRETVEAIRTAVSEGAGIVGVWLEPAFTGPPSWWLSGGQYHYLGVHHTVEQAKTWGACMTVDTRLARQIDLTFRGDLGRRGSNLQSGEDTTFLASLRAAGAAERFLRDSVAAHQVGAERTRLGYLLRRSWWQGRSEVCRRSAMASLGKEWRRGVTPGPAAAGVGRRYLLGGLYTGAVLAGIVTEDAIRAARAGRGLARGWRSGPVRAETKRQAPRQPSPGEGPAV